MTPEGRVKKDIKAYLTAIGAYQFWPVQMGYGTATIDCLACVRGRFYGIEVKRVGGKATPRQELVLSAILASGGGTCVADNPMDVRELIGRDFPDLKWTQSGKLKPTPEEEDDLARPK